MRNHWHLFLSTPEANLSRVLHDLNSGYASLFNRRHRGSGALYQGRFKAILVQEQGYAWTLRGCDFFKKAYCTESVIML